MCLLTRNPVQGDELGCASGVTRLKNRIEIVGRRCTEQDYQSYGDVHRLTTRLKDSTDTVGELCAEQDYENYGNVYELPT